MDSSYAGGRRVSTWALSDTGAASTWSTYADALLAIQHPALVRVVEAVAIAGAARLVVEAEAGEPVDAWVARTDPTVPERLAVLRAGAAGLDALHTGSGSSPGIAHGDVRPINLLVRPDGSAVLTGFSPWVASSDAFTAPELVAGTESTAAGDAYAFARLLAEVLVGPTDLPTDTNGLVRDLRTHPNTRRRPGLVTAIRDALSGPPETRPRGLQAWLTEATEGTATGGAAEQELPDPPTVRRGRVRVLIVVGALATVVAATAAGIGWSHRGSDLPATHPSTSALQVAATWYPVDTCYGATTQAATAMGLGGRAITDASRVADLDDDPDSGRWGRGLARLSLTASGGRIVQVVDMALRATSEDAPNWVLVPPTTPCHRPPRGTRDYVLHLDDPWQLRVANQKPGMPPLPDFAVRPGRTTTIAVEVAACDLSRQWRLKITYYLPGQGLRRYTVMTPPLRLYATAEDRTQAYAGTPENPTHTGQNPRPEHCPL